MTNDIRRWLMGLGLERYIDTFVDHEIDLDTVRFVSDRDLAELGVALGARRRILAAAAEVGERPRVEAVDAERRQLTLMFCDLVGSTELSQRIDPEDLRDVMRAYQDVVVGAVRTFGGHVANYLGDGILAYFGWPHADEDQAAQAVRAGLAAVSGVSGVTVGPGRRLESRVGIATGTVIVGDLVGERGRDVDAVIGTTPNLAARLEGLARSGEVVIESATLQLLGRQFDVRDLGPQLLKGFDQPVPAHVVLRERPAASRFEQSHGATLTAAVGRDAERRLLLDLWERAAGGSGQVVTIAGDAGIGKSRLVQELIDGVTAPLADVRLQCSPLHANTAFFPISQRLSRAARFAVGDDGPTRLDKLARLLAFDGPIDVDELALIAGLLSIDAPRPAWIGVLAPLELRRRTSEALINQVVTMCRSAPMVLTVEDMHWVDPSTESLLDDLIERITDAPMLLVLTHRPDYRPTRTTTRTATSVTLNRLGREQCAAIVRDVSGAEPAAELIDAIVSRSDGNPLFVEELTRTLLRAGRTADDLAATTAEIPTTLESSLMARLDQLGTAKEVAQVASVVGREFTTDLVAGLLSIPVAVLRPQLATLVELRVVHEQDDADGSQYTFRHALLQEAAYASMLHSRRRDLHLKLAEQIERRGSGPDIANPEVLARHFDLGERPALAARYFAIAGRQAAARYANDEAISHFEQALERLPPGDESTEFEIRVALGVVLIAAHGYAAASVEQNYLRAQEIDDGTLSTSDRFAVVRGLWNCYFDRGDLQRSRQLANELVELAERSGDDLLGAFSARSLGSVELMRGEIANATRLLESGRDARERSTAALDLHAFGEDPGVICEMYLGWTKTALGDVNEGLRCSEVAAQRARAGGQPIAIAFADTLRVVPLVWAGFTERARAVADALEEFTRTHRLVFWAASAQAYQGWTRIDGADAERGLRMMIAGFDAWKRTGAGLHIPTFQRIIMDGRLATGDVAGARRAGRAATHACDRSGENLHRADILRLLAACDVAAGDLVGAERLLRQAVDVASATGAGLFQLRAAEALARLLADGDRRDEAAAVLASASAQVDVETDAPVVVRARELLDALA